MVERRLIAPSTTIKKTASSKQSGGVTGNKNPMLHNNLSRVIRWFKGRTTFESHKINKEFGWQSGFFEHIIRDEKSYLRVKSYIRRNPENRAEDKFK